MGNWKKVAVVICVIVALSVVGILLGFGVVKAKEVIASRLDSNPTEFGYELDAITFDGKGVRAWELHLDKATWRQFQRVSTSADDLQKNVGSLVSQVMAKNGLTGCSSFYSDFKHPTNETEQTVSFAGVCSRPYVPTRHEL